MRILKRALFTFAGLILIAVVTLLALGGWRGSTHLESQIEITKPPDVVFRWVTDGEHNKKWVSWLVRVEEQTPGVTGTGRRYVFVMNDPNMSEQVRVQSEVIAFETDRFTEARVGMQSGFEGRARYDLSPTPAGTRLHSRADFSYDHWFARLLSPIVTWQAQQKLDSDLATLKRLAEAEN
jgi:uncharacterized protein YndB with AHSA1/START domain